ncbi:hypothetical protein Sarmat_01194 [Rickettsiales endosymbiont of Paramecium tredecaurelia]|nr:hypothetical protein [Candidatus Sarmatiella mevalonica]
MIRSLDILHSLMTYVSFTRDRMIFTHIITRPLSNSLSHKQMKTQNFQHT